MVNVTDVNLPDANSLLATVSIPSISFKDSKIGDSFTGTITALESAQVRDFDTNEPKFWDDGKPQLQVVLTLDTDYRDPQNSDDEGERKLYLVGAKLTAAKAAMKEFGKPVAVGDVVTITFTGEKPNANKRFNATKLYGVKFTAGTGSNKAVDAILGAGAEEVSAKLTDEQVAKIKTLSTNGFDDSEIAAAVKVNLYDVKAVLAAELI